MQRGGERVVQSEDDIKTEYVASGESGAANRGQDNDGTVLFGLGVNPIVPDRVPAPREYFLVRERTGDRLRMQLPAVIGRGVAATTKVSGNLAISRKHARVQMDQGRLTIVDLGSVNGTRVRGDRIPQNMAVEIHDGDEVRLASEVFWISSKG